MLLSSDIIILISNTVKCYFTILLIILFLYSIIHAMEV
nr:MAG TPA: hypothetical protein [Caudoviricetes sp.]